LITLLEQDTVSVSLG